MALCPLSSRTRLHFCLSSSKSRTLFCKHLNKILTAEEIERICAKRNIKASELGDHIIMSSRNHRFVEDIFMEVGKVEEVLGEVAFWNGDVIECNDSDDLPVSYHLHQSSITKDQLTIILDYYNIWYDEKFKETFMCQYDWNQMNNRVLVIACCSMIWEKKYGVGPMVEALYNMRLLDVLRHIPGSLEIVNRYRRMHPDDKLPIPIIQMQQVVGSIDLGFELDFELAVRLVQLLRMLKNDESNSDTVSLDTVTQLLILKKQLSK